ncbi:MAG: DUF1800 domain-containing protein [Ferruginibacter sp.]
MDRRDFFSPGKARKKPLTASASPYRTLSGIDPYTGPWTENEVIHLLKRTLFGAKKADIDFFKAMTMQQAVDYLLNVTTAQTQPSPPVKNYASSTTAGDPDIAIPAGQTWVNTNTTDGSVNFNRTVSFKTWWMGQIISQERNILEKMTLFWHNHFSTETQVIDYAIWCYQNNVVLRKNALGNFKTFVREMTLNTGMLRYQNGYLNTNTAPDENYGRELQELFTVGKGADNATQAYSEADVKAAARVLTGWQINGTTNTAVFTPSRHDTGNKQFSSFYNNTVITGRSGATAGDLELTDLLNMIFSVDNVSLHICRKLYRWFVYYEIDAATEANVIAPLAQIFRANNYEIKPVLAALFKSQHFFDAANQGCLIKNPVDMLVGLCREFSVVFPSVTTDYAGAYDTWLLIGYFAILLQQELGDPPNVAGWPAYYQAPQFHEIWINSDTFPKRNQFSDQMLLTGFTRNGKNIRIDPTLFAKSLPNPGDPNALVSDSIFYLLRLPLTQASKDQLKKDIILGGQTSDYYWTNAWNAWIANPNDTTNANIVKTKLRDLYQYLMKLAEYQLS